MYKLTMCTLCTFSIFVIALITPASVTANEMALTFEEQGVTIAGQYAGFRENAYVLVTTAGTLHVPANLVKCQGVDCVELLAVATQDN